MAKNKFYVAKVNVNQNIFTTDQKLSDIINIKIPEQILKFSKNYIGLYHTETTPNGEEIRWTLANTQKLSDNFLIGYLSKSKPLEYNTVTEDNKIKEEQPENVFSTEFCYFVYNIKKEILIFDTNRFINRDTFIRVFKKLLEFEDGLEQIGEVEIVMMTETTELRSILSSKQVVYFKVEIVHPNSRRRQFNSMKKTIDEMNAKKLTQTMSNDNGLKVVSDNNESEDEDNEFTPVVSESLEMSEAGYAEIDLAYIEKGKRLTSSSKASPVVVSVDSFDSENINHEELIEQFTDKLDK